MSMSQRNENFLLFRLRQRRGYIPTVISRGHFSLRRGERDSPGEKQTAIAYATTFAYSEIHAEAEEGADRRACGSPPLFSHEEGRQNRATNQPADHQNRSTPCRYKHPR